MGLLWVLFGCLVTAGICDENSTITQSTLFGDFPELPEIPRLPDISMSLFGNASNWSLTTAFDVQPTFWGTNETNVIKINKRAKNCFIRDVANLPAKDAYVTLCTSTKYIKAVQMLGKSLSSVGSTKPRVVLITPGLLGQSQEFLSAGWQVCVVDNIPHPRQWSYYINQLTNSLLPFPNDTFNDLHTWDLPVRRAVYLDADMLALKNPDSLFQMALPPNYIGAAPPVVLETEIINATFNSGMMVIQPNHSVFEDLLSKVTLGGVEEMLKGNGDGAFLRAYYEGRWVRIDPVYNFIAKNYELAHFPSWTDTENFPLRILCALSGNQQCDDVVAAHIEDIVIVHYAHCEKPWLHLQDIETAAANEDFPYLFRLYKKKAEEFRLA